MPSRDKTTRKHALATPPAADSHLVFFPIVVLTLLLWFVYRSLFTFPVWFDESIGKAIFFGLPVWFFVVITNYKAVAETFSLKKLQSGLLLGLAVGGVYGFVTSLLSLWQTGSTVQAAWLFTSNAFWYEFFLALLTAFWETLLFYSFCMTVVMDKYPQWSLARKVVLVGVIFVLFHIPNTYLRFTSPEVIPQLLLLFLFGLGQALLFAERRNAYALVLSHAIWGMVLLTHAG
jgi:hypothetical protein